MALRVLIGRQTSFAISLSKHVGAAIASDTNLVLSPLSIHLALALVAAGSSGYTFNQTVSFLGIRSGKLADLSSLSSQIVALVLADGLPRGGPRVSFANGVFVDSSLPLKPSFNDIVINKFKAEVNAVDFQTNADVALNEVNSWVENVTSNLIKELLPPGSVDKGTRLVLGNALYFKGSWTEKFDASKTLNSEFYLLNGTSVEVAFITSTKKQFLSSYDGFKVLRLPYKQGQDKRSFSMYIFLPDAKDGLWDLEERLNSESELLTRYLPMRKVEVNKFKMPKFKISFGFEASSVLKGLGLVSPFSADADLSEMVDSPFGRSLFVSSIFHKSFIEVNEEGTVATAASAALATITSMALPMNPLNFEADHPFMFLIREDTTGVVLFTGHVLNPSIAQSISLDLGQFFFFP
ncbi:serpin-ZXA-like [Zingiber officinale]|uniref:serpin-ZXA-like n=1 Tax=Zingiber officinale TaxID=94328 RepID=UPI001C4AD246|nr:serpin-ZXA-like [Zingiber officinale]